MKKEFTHTGVLSGDARNGGRRVRTRLRLTPSGSHWVDQTGRRYRKTGGGCCGEKWPLWFLHTETIQPLASVDTHPQGGDSEAAPFMSGAVLSEETGDAQPSVKSQVSHD